MCSVGTPEGDYKHAFGLQGPLDRNKAEKALNLALDIRKFEIGLYWQRAAYFWALIAAAFAGYFAILDAERLDDRQFLSFVVGCVGMFFTWAWFLVNKGSKFWQENWENHVDMLEDVTVGPLYKTILRRPRKGGGIVLGIIGPEGLSVSRINQWVSLFTLCIWITLVTSSLSGPHGEHGWKGYVAVGCFTVFFALLSYFKSRTHLGTQDHVIEEREGRITPEDSQ